MLRRDIDEDLFRDSTMTFGQHLEELRGALFRSILGVAVTILIGLAIGDRVVAVIKHPLEQALATYYLNQSSKLVASDATTKSLEQERLLADEVYINPHQLIDQLEKNYPQAAKSLASALTTDAEPNKADPNKSGAEASPAPEKSAEKAAAPAAGVAPESLTNVKRENMIRLFLLRPFEGDSRVRPTSLSAQEAFSIYMKASVLVALVMAAPWIFYQLWNFVAAGLYPHEKRYVHVFLPISIGLFLGGVGLAFFFVFQPVLDFLLSFNQWLGIDPDPRISEWLGFVLMLPLGFGIAFQLPLVMLFFERIGVMSVELYLSYWRVAVLIIFVLAMVLTPSDPYSMMLMAIPLTFLYFGGTLLCRLMPRMRSPYDEAGTR